MTSNFNTLFAQYMSIVESNEHISEPQQDMPDPDTHSFAHDVVTSLQANGVLEDWIDIEHFITSDSTLNGDESKFSWTGYQGKYVVRIRKINNAFNSTITCDDKPLKAPTNNGNVNLETYARNIADFIAKQEKSAEETHSKEENMFKGEDVIQPTSNQPSALPGAPVAGAPGPQAPQ